MRRALVLPLALIVSLSSQSYGVEWAIVVDRFFSVTTHILSGGRTLFDELAKTQALDVTDDLYSRATSLFEAKRRLRENMNNGNLDMSQLDDIAQKTRDMSWPLQKFANEIDKVSGLTAGDLRGESQSLLNSKMQELVRISETWNPNDKAKQGEALAMLDSAMEKTKKFQRACKCLSETLKTKKQACDVKDL